MLLLYILKIEGKGEGMGGRQEEKARMKGKSKVVFHFFKKMCQNQNNDQVRG